MANGLPYFKWYPKDAETDILYCRMTDQELGLYHRCLNLSWINGGLPADLADLAEALGKPLEYIERMWPRLSKCFILLSTDPSKYVNPRQEKERQAASELSEKRASAGKQGGRPQKQLLSKSKANPYDYDSDYESKKKGGVGGNETSEPSRGAIGMPPATLTNALGRVEPNPDYLRVQEALRNARSRIAAARNPFAYEQRIIKQAMSG